MSVFEILQLVGLYAILGTVLWIGFTLLRLTKHRLQIGPIHPGHHHSSKPTGYVVWEWREARWRRISDTLPVGTDPGPPPFYPGDVDGDRVKTWPRTPDV